MGITKTYDKSRAEAHKRAYPTALSVDERVVINKNPYLSYCKKVIRHKGSIDMEMEFADTAERQSEMPDSELQKARNKILWGEVAGFLTAKGSKNPNCNR